MNKKKFLILTILMAFFVFSCDSRGVDIKDNAQEEDIDRLSEESANFLFRIKDDGTAAVVGLSESGKEQTDLDIPSKTLLSLAKNSNSRLISKGSDSQKSVVVTSIDDSAFEGSKSVASIHIPNSVTSIGSNAFKDCSSLTKVNIPDGVSQINSGTFNGCSSLENISLSNVSECESSAFDNCDNLKHVSATPLLADKIGSFFGEETVVVAYIASEFFKYSVYGDGVWIEGLTEKGKEQETMEMPSNIDGKPIVHFGYSIFADSKVKKIVFPDTYSSVPSFTCDCSDTLEEVYLSSSIKVIENYAFRGDTALKKVIMEGVETVHTYAFLNCSSLRNVELPYSAKCLDIYSFLGCPIDSMKIPDDAAFDTTLFDESKIVYKPSKYIYDETADGVIIKGINRDVFDISQTEYTIPKTIKNRKVIALADNADFAGCEFTSVFFPRTVKNIGSNVFAGCNNLAKVKYFSQTQVADDAFSESVEKVTLGGASSKGSIFSEECIFNYNIADGSVLIDTFKQEFHFSFVDGEVEFPFEIYIPYKVDGIPVRNVFLDMLAHEYALLVRFRSDLNEDGSKKKGIIYLPADQNGKNPLMGIDYDYMIQRVNEMRRWEDNVNNIQILTYYCPELDTLGKNI